MPNENFGPPAGAMAASGANRMGGGYEQPAVANFVENAGSFLVNLTRRSPSLDNLSQLAGSVASYMKDETNPQLAALYLQAVAQQLSAASPQNFHTGASLGDAPLAGVFDGSATNALQSPSQTSTLINQILDAVSIVVTRVAPRSAISKSGILPVMATILLRSSSISGISKTSAGSNFALGYSTDNNHLGSNDQGFVPMPTLTKIHVEFLHACLYAEQYRYAEGVMAHTWPRPDRGMAVADLLRYYYTRGSIHMASQHWDLALRCFWTCLAVPADQVSAIVVAAWKKMVLVQCMLHSDIPPDQFTEGPLVIPKAAASCLSRFLNQASMTVTTTRGEPVVPVSARLPEEPPEVAMHIVEGLAEGVESRPEGRYREAEGAGAVASSQVARSVSAYVQLVQAFIQVDRARFGQLLQECLPVFTEDGNVGMIRQCQRELDRRQVYQVSRVYSVIPIENLTRLLSLPVDQVEKILLQLSVERVWAIRIQDGMVSFPSLSPKRSLQNHTEELQYLTQLIQRLDLAVASSPKYTAFARKEGASANKDSRLAGPPRGVEDI